MRKLVQTPLEANSGVALSLCFNIQEKPSHLLRSQKAIVIKEKFENYISSIFKTSAQKISLKNELSKSHSGKKNIPKQCIRQKT